MKRPKLFSTHRFWMLVLAALFCSGTPVLALAGWNEAEKAPQDDGNASTPMEQRDSACKASEERPKDQKAKKQCEDAKFYVTNELAKFNNLLISGKGLMAEGKFDEARRKFERILWGPDFKQAHKYLEPGGMEGAKPPVVVQATPVPVAPKPAEDASFRDGQATYNKGEYESASAFLSKVPDDSPNKSKAQDYLKIIASYNGKVGEARGFVQQNNYLAAQQAYSAAAGIANGRAADDARTQARQMELLAKTNMPRPQPAVAPPVITKNSHEPPAPPDNRDHILVEGVDAFYKGNMDSIKQAERSLRDYLVSDGSRKGAAYFYLGASNLVHYYLLDSKLDQEQRADLQRQALDNFKKAKEVKGFVPPEKYVSPKILEEYKKAG